jgi:hypothetical protein
MIASTSISIFMRGSAGCASNIVAAGRTSPNAVRGEAGLRESRRRS